MTLENHKYDGTNCNGGASECFCSSCIQKMKEAIHQDGYNTGYDDGYDEGYEDGYEDGYDAAIKETKKDVEGRDC